MKKRTKKYQGPKPVSPVGGLVLVAAAIARGEQAAPLTGLQQSDVGAAYWLSLENLRLGDANEESWSAVVCALNVGLALCEAEIAQEDYTEQFNAALTGAFRAKIRSNKNGGNFRLDGAAMRDIETALEIHDLQMQVATRGEVTAALQLVRDRVDSGNVFTEVEA